MPLPPSLREECTNDRIYIGQAKLLIRIIYKSSNCVSDKLPFHYNWALFVSVSVSQGSVLGFFSLLIHINDAAETLPAV